MTAQPIITDVPVVPARQASRLVEPTTVCRWTPFRAVTSTRTSCASWPRPRRSAPPVGGQGRLQRRRARLRLAAPRRQRRRLADLLDAGERHRLARPRRLVRRGRGRPRQAASSTTWPSAPSRSRPRSKPATSTASAPTTSTASPASTRAVSRPRLQPAPVAHGPVLRRGRRPAPRLRLVRRRTPPARPELDAAGQRAVDDEVGAADPAGHRAGEEDHRCGDLLRACPCGRWG